MYGKDPHISTSHSTQKRTKVFIEAAHAPYPEKGPDEHVGRKALVFARRFPKLGLPWVVEGLVSDCSATTLAETLDHSNEVDIQDWIRDVLLEVFWQEGSM